MSVNTTGYEFLTAVADQCNDKDIRAFIVEQLKCWGSSHEIYEMLEEAGYEATDVDIYKFTRNIEEQIYGIKVTHDKDAALVLNAIHDLKDFIKLQNHGALQQPPINMVCNSPTCPNRIRWNGFNNISCTSSTSSNDGS